MKKLLRFMKEYKKEAILAPLFKMLEASFELLIPIVMKLIIDVGIAQRDKSYVIQMCFAMVALGIIGLLCSVTAQYFSARAAVGYGTKVRHALFSHIQTFSYKELDLIGNSKLITHMTSDINQTQTGVNLVLRLFLRSPFIVFGAAIMAFTIDIKSALIFVITIPLLSLVIFGIMILSIPLFKKVQESLDQILKKLRGNLTGVRVIRAFHKEEEEEKEFQKRNDYYTELQKKVGRLSAFLNPLTYVLVNGAIMLLIWTGAKQTNEGILTTGEVVALVNYMSQILVELVKLANLIITVNKAIACGNRIQNIFEFEGSIKEGSIDFIDSLAEYAVEFQNVSFTYDGAGDETLSNLNFQVQKGQVVGITGGTGAGKSSLVQLIPRLYDVTKGEIRIYGKNVKEYNSDFLRDHIGYVPQKATLLKGTLIENLRMGKENISEEQIKRVLEISQAMEIVTDKPEGLLTEVSQNGKNFSGGQKQRLTIARALAKSPEILILDDSTSALDYGTDAALRKALMEMDERPTLFLVSQRTVSMMNADVIIVLEDGKIAGLGTHSELLKSCNVYQEIYYSQFPEKERA